MHNWKKSTQPIATEPSLASTHGAPDLAVLNTRHHVFSRHRDRSQELCILFKITDNTLDKNSTIAYFTMAACAQNCVEGRVPSTGAMLFLYYSNFTIYAVEASTAENILNN